MVSVLTCYTGGADFSPRKGSEFLSMIIARLTLDIYILNHVVECLEVSQAMTPSEKQCESWQM